APLMPGSSSAVAKNSATFVFFSSGSVERASCASASTAPRPGPTGTALLGAAPRAGGGVAALGPTMGAPTDAGPPGSHVEPAAGAGVAAPGAPPPAAGGIASGATFHCPDIMIAPLRPTPFGPYSSGRPR